MQVDFAPGGVEAHGVAGALGGRVAVAVRAAEAGPEGVRLTGVEVGVEEAGFGDLFEEAFGGVPVAVEDDAFVELTDERVLCLQASLGEDRFVRREESSLAKVLQDVAENQ